MAGGKQSLQEQLFGGAQGQGCEGGAGWAVQGLQRGEGTTGVRMATLLSTRLLFHLLSFTVEEKGRQEGRDSRKGQRGKGKPGWGALRGVRKRERGDRWS